MSRTEGNRYSTASSRGWSARGAAANKSAEIVRSPTRHQRATKTAWPTERLALPQNSGCTSPASASAAANAQTIAAPVGRSNRYDDISPTALASAPTDQPMASWRGMLSAYNTPTAAGMIKNENTNSTPA